mmetsp:Transcript_7989/g.18021  ORF Transcript_7989/g.18021 Transcript_7989/m.18021 type:complete len:736 (-) Transcript_7989:180-2387(-)|eukprot:CAMPEP_0172298946 /NCGR_PEP_ID=MMETSP1058-20130122/1362_1 /TAXON_ID=83371 /ORGANISM="Detonula confervacea, Strain CCMP 353" /LENGTH=735 /DNA_ID=CAMNT_0013008241 /DNA_START=313 /DNA_END=2520 /DNA_ORIENTATION=-
MILSWNLAAASILSLAPIVVEGLVLPSPLASTHNVLRLSDGRHGRRHSVNAPPAMTQSFITKQRNGPLNVMSMDQNMDTTESGSMVPPDPINVTTLVDATSLDVIDWVDAAEVAAHVQGTATELAPTPAELAMKRRVELHEFEEEVMVIKSPPHQDEPPTLAAATPQENDVQEEAPISSAVTYKTLAADHPSISKIIKFSLPAIGVWLCSPVLSMIDTASVGLLAGTAQQAALNPAVSVTDYGALLVAFMYTATTNLIAGAVEKDSADTTVAGQPRTAKTLVTALRLALLVGVAFGSILGTFAPLLLKVLIGNSTLDPVVFQSALRYVQIRSLGMPAAVVIGTAQSACLGMKDVKSPLYVLAAAAGINLCADILLVPSASLWFGGAAGAAWATVFSQYGALIMFLRWLTVKSKKDVSGETLNPMDMIKDTTREAGKNVKVTFGNAIEKGTTIRKNLFSSKKQSKVTPEKDNNDALARGFLSHSHKAVSILNPLRLTRAKSTIKKFLPFVVPVTTTSIGRVSGFLTMSHVASSAFGTLDMAAHQIAISIFCCLAPIVDALNQVAQSFVPGIFARPKSRARALALRKTSVNFAKVGALFGSVIVALVATGIPVVSKGFTTDPAVLSRVKNAIPGIAIFLGFDGLMCIGEGTLLGQNDLKFLRNMYASFFFLVPAFMFRLKRRALSGIEVGIGTMWLTFSAYEVVRTILWLSRMVFLQRKMEREVDEMEAEAAAVTAV